MTWNPQRYLEFADLRLRPAVDLLARVPASAPRAVADLGCGAGNVTKLLAERWPGAAIIGVDSSRPMLDKARGALAGASNVRFEERDLATWTPDAPVDVVYSNAALHWLDRHADLFPRLMTTLAPGGVLAVQMPSNFGTPSHASVAAIAQSERWRARIGDLVREAPVDDPVQYVRWLAPASASLDVWETTYQQRLAPRDDGEHPVVAFVSGTWLVPYFERLADDPPSREAFLREYRERIARAFPPEADGTTLFPFRRLFMVATAR
ncbi:MAG TPA: methyltransferase domain-containing protein [Casimicrobiaceae bacterium]|jgi:trans-aconitate 2-methyltransferase